MKGYTHDEAEDFLEKVDDIHQQVQDIISGKTDCNEADRIYKEKEKMDAIKAEIKTREADQRQKKGRPGKGYKRNGWKMFCQPCQTEYQFDTFDKCTECGRDTVSFDDRMEMLQGKVEDHKKKTRRKLERRAKWDNWKKTQELFYSKTSTNYTKWDMFESSEEEKNEDDEPIVPSDDPQFQAMEADFKDRAAKRKKSRKLANELKAKGNDCLKKGLYKSANKHYTDALEEVKDILPLYTNRALARIRLEMFQDVIDDCTRVLEYCDVFDETYTKQRDLCYKAFMRRAQGLRGLKDFDFAVKDLDEALKLFPEEADPERLKTLYHADQELDKRINKIMENAEALKGKEYIDFLLQYLQGKDSQPEDGEKKKVAGRQPEFCKNELKKDEASKLKGILVADADLVLYFNAKDGFKVLVDSLAFGIEALPILSELLPNDDKLREDFQRQHLYEGLIDFMHKKNVNTEVVTLDPLVIYDILILLENASMNEAVRMNLSEKKKIKDLFMVVIRSVDIKENRTLVASLIQFASNLCYGTNKFRRMLIKSEEPVEFIKTISDILTSAAVPEKPLKGEKNKEKVKMQPEAKRVLLKQACLIFIGNLCVEQQLRAYIASDMGGLLSQVINMFETDVKTQPFDWVESTNKQLQVLVNCGLETSAQTIMSETTILKSIEIMLDSFDVLPTEPEKKEALSRVISLFAKLMKTTAGSLYIISSKEIISRVLLYFMTDEPEYFKNALITFHACCRHPDFRQSCLEKLGFELKHFDPYVAKANKKFTEAYENEDWDGYTNICASISAFCTTFPERKSDFKDVIPPLIKVMGDKLDSVRKNSAVLLAKLVEEHEDNKKIMKANHGSEILMSVQQAMMK